MLKEFSIKTKLNHNSVGGNEVNKLDKVKLRSQELIGFANLVLSLMIYMAVISWWIIWRGELEYF